MRAIIWMAAGTHQSARASDTKSPGRNRSIANGRLALAVVDGFAETGLTGGADEAVAVAVGDDRDGDGLADAEGVAMVGHGVDGGADDAEAAAATGATPDVEAGDGGDAAEPHDHTTAARHSAASPCAECAAERSRAPIPA
jgi:hypothetical protein